MSILKKYIIQKNTTDTILETDMAKNAWLGHAYVLRIRTYSMYVQKNQCKLLFFIVL